jgi:type IV pilus secretin PilQ/predicted competence protein
MHVDRVHKKQQQQLRNFCLKFSFFKEKSPTLIGVDITSASIKMVELSSDANGQYQLDAYVISPIANLAMTDGNVADLEKVAEAISTAWKLMGSRQKRVALALPSATVISKKVSLPADLSEDDMAYQVEAEANQYIPFSLDEVNIDFQVLGPTANQHKAKIASGTEIPYAEASSSGAATISFKSAVLSLEVTPQITPDNKIIMELDVTKDSVGEVYAGVPSIKTQNISTQVLVGNGETAVLGGIYEQTQRNDVSKVPFFGDLPVMGRLFQRKTSQNDRTELLIFVTPKIMDDSLTLR